mmetsp:Transcript_1108/g.2381  ORF Transcript_1108/g.2381 Transcript_1108/m.2381 type:complete len:622 (+) Transcript_1108:333-2198(+)
MGRASVFRRSGRAEKASLLKADDDDGEYAQQIFPDASDAVYPSTVKESSQMDVSSATGATEESQHSMSLGSVNNSFHSMQLSVADNDDDEDDEEDSDPEAEQGKFLADFSAFMTDGQEAAGSPKVEVNDNSTSHASAEDLSKHIGELPSSPGKKNKPGWMSRKHRSKSEEIKNPHVGELATKPSPKKNSREIPSRAKSMEEKPPGMLQKIGSPVNLMRKKRRDGENAVKEYVPPSGLDAPLQEETTTGHGSEVEVKEVSEDYVQMSFGVDASSDLPVTDIRGNAASDEKEDFDESDNEEETTESKEAETVKDESKKKSRSRRHRQSSRASKKNNLTDAAAAAAASVVAAPSRSSRKSMRASKSSKKKDQEESAPSKSSRKLTKELSFSRINHSESKDEEDKMSAPSRGGINRSKSTSSLMAGAALSKPKLSKSKTTGGGRKVSRRKSMNSGESPEVGKKSSRRKSGKHVIKVSASDLKDSPDELADVAAALSASNPDLSSESAAALAAAIGGAESNSKDSDASPAKPARRRSGRLMGMRVSVKDQTTKDSPDDGEADGDGSSSKKQTLKDRLTRYIPRTASFRQKRRASLSQKTQHMVLDDDDDEQDLANDDLFTSPKVES